MSAPVGDCSDSPTTTSLFLARFPQSPPVHEHIGNKKRTVSGNNSDRLHQKHFRLLL